MNIVECPEWIDLSDVCELHDTELICTGGMPGLRDQGALETACRRPANKFDFDGERCLFVLAAAYAYGIATLHPFVDGNKRTAFYCAASFLRVHGRLVRADSDEGSKMMCDLVTKEVTEEQFAEWLESVSHPCDPIS